MLANLIGQTLDDKYQIESELGKGGMGAVYLATHLGTERPVAVKVIAPEFMKNEEFVERFRREARAAGRMRHPNIVDVTDFGFASLGNDQVAYLVMEYLDGCTLAEVLAEEEHLPLSWVTDILEQACSAVDEAHQNGIVHRDLKPDNIWLEPNRRGGYTVKVLDFGIAKVGDAIAFGLSPSVSQGSPGAADNDSLGSLSWRKEAQVWALRESATLLNTSSGTQAIGQSEEAGTVLFSAKAATDNIGNEEAGTQILISPSGTEDRTRLLPGRPTGDAQDLTTSSASSLTRVGSILGTPLYMSPEQCRGEFSDARSDIYSLGVIAYQMLAGKTPFTGDLSTVMKGHMEVPPPALDKTRVPKKVSKVLMSALAKKPDDRPSTAAGFANELRAYSEGGVALLRRALTLFTEHLPTFVKVSALIYLPVIVVTGLQLSISYLVSHERIPKIPGLVLSAMISLVLFVVSFFTAAVLIGVITRLVTQLLAAPLRPLRVRPAFMALRKRLRQLLPTTMLFNFLTVVGLILFIIPGLIILVNYSLITPVMMMEDVHGRAAFKRAKLLAKRSRRTVAVVLFLQFVFPVIVTSIIGFVVVSAMKAFNPAGVKANLFSVSVQVLQLPANIVMGAFSAIVIALLYLKMRQAGGETLKEAVEKFDEEELPNTKWQKRMRDKSRVMTRITR